MVALTLDFQPLPEPCEEGFVFGVKRVLFGTDSESLELVELHTGVDYDGGPYGDASPTLTEELFRVTDDGFEPVVVQGVMDSENIKVDIWELLPF